MAIWQYTIFFIPRTAVIKRYGEIPAQLEHYPNAWDDYFENATAPADSPTFEDAFSIEWWSELSVSFETLIPYLEQFGEIVDWTKDSTNHKTFGDSSTNDISVHYDLQTQVIQELSCRLDISNLNEVIISTIMEITKYFDCLLMNSKAEVFEADVNELLDHIKASNSNRFITNPQQFFDDLSSGKIKPE